MIQLVKVDGLDGEYDVFKLSDITIKDGHVYEPMKVTRYIRYLATGAWHEMGPVGDVSAQITGSEAVKLDDMRAEGHAYTLNELSGVPEINLTMMSVPIVAHPRKLKTNMYGKNGTYILSKYKIVIWLYKVWWSIFPPKEIELNAYHSVDAEEDLTKILADGIKENIDEKL